MPNPAKRLKEGARFGKWTVVQFCGRMGKVKGGYHKCICECGTVGYIQTRRLLKGESLRCRKGKCNKLWEGGVKSYGSVPWARARLATAKHRATQLGYEPPRCTPEEAARMVKDAKGECECCGTKARKLCLDHCHKTGFVRGVICDRCNRVLGWVGESQRVMNMIGRYLSAKCIQRRIPMECESA